MSFQADPNPRKTLIRIHNPGRVEGVCAIKLIKYITKPIEANVFKNKLEKTGKGSRKKNH